jgi:amino acid adenylation domain-containing protein
MAFLLHQLLSESAQRCPDNIAIIFEGQSVTYSELERQSNKLAFELLRRGTTKSSRIGIHMNRGITSVMSACAILKAGAAYVPIDPMAPLGRLQYIVAKCGIKTILTVQNKLKTIEEAFADRPPFENILIMDGIDPSRQTQAAVNLVDGQNLPDDIAEILPNVHTIDSDLAYILFTSGSTGNPKGVMISHLNSLTFVNAAHDFFKITQEDRLSNNSPLHFDLSIFDIFVAFKAGASVVIVPETTSIFPIKIAQFIEKNKISVWNSVPSALSLLANYEKLNNHDLESMRLILFAGEVFPLKYLRILKKYIPTAQYYNIYGQTEANSSLYYRVDQLPLDDADTIPIGKTFPNFEVFALDENNLVIGKTGEKGELYVRGSSVAYGYWDEPEKTASSFVNNPIGLVLNEKIYRTGDMVTINDQGEYLFLGRKDHMIKSRGYRIEIGEIETTLLGIEQIKKAVVVPIADELIGNRIAAIIIPSSEGCIQKEEIIRYCSQRLPKYMIPEIFDFQDSLPMTSSGKIDRKLLTQQMSLLFKGNSDLK